MEEKIPEWAKTLIENQKILSEAVDRLSGNKEEEPELEKQELAEDEASAEECERIFGDIKV